MKWLSIFLLSLISAGILGVSLVRSQTQSEQTPVLAHGTSKETISQTADGSSEIRLVQTPVKLSIPKIGVDAYVEHVGLDKDKNMDVPKENENVAWYELGFAPGQIGNAVIAGHFDTKTGSPAVFYNLDQLLEGDSIFVTDTRGARQEFKVTGKQKYQYDEVPIVQIFGDADGSHLNLITCEGAFNQDSQVYSHRLVIFSEKVS